MLENITEQNFKRDVGTNVLAINPVCDGSPV